MHKNLFLIHFSILILTFLVSGMSNFPNSLENPFLPIKSIMTEKFLQILEFPFPERPSDDLMNSLLTFFPEFFLAGLILMITLYGSLVLRSANKDYASSKNNLKLLSVLVLISVAILEIYHPYSDENIVAFNGLFISNKFIVLSKVFITLATAICLFISENNLIKNKINNFEYFVLVLSSVLGMMFLVSANNFMSFYISLEIMSLPLYVLAAAKKTSTMSTDAGMKYFVLGCFASALLLFGVSLIYGSTGTVNFSSLTVSFKDLTLVDPRTKNLVTSALVLIIIAMLFKVAATPCHMWAPDVYEGAPTASTVFFSTVPKMALFSIFIRLFCVVFSSFFEVWTIMILVSAFLSVLVGSVLALRQKKVKRLLAYSSVAHVGYMLLGFSSNSSEGIQFVIFYLIIYIITNLGIWAIVLSIRPAKNEFRSLTLIDLANIAKNNPLLGVLSLIHFFSLAGIPPLVGFYAKMMLFTTAINSSLLLISVIIILISVISAFFYIRLIKNLYFENTKIVEYKPIPFSCSLVLLFTSFSLLYLFKDPSLLLWMTDQMTRALF